MRTLIVNGDDFGLSPGVNDGIVEAHTRGVLTSTSLMVTAPASAGAAELAKSYPELSVGLHFVDDSPQLDDPGYAAEELNAQLERFRALIGRDPTHVDAHHHVHARGGRITTFARLVEPLGVPLRLAGQVRYIGGFYAHTRPGVSNIRFVSQEYLVHVVANEAFEGFNELGCHPALRGDFDSSYRYEREVELATLTEPGLREELDHLGVQLASFHDWAVSEASRASPPGASI
ncbi:MAG: ChbG/HpnK family deacetylase [Solirubrobacteraceae bacterium]